MSKGCLEFIWRVFGRCLDGFSGNIKGVLRLHGGYLEVVWKVSGSIHEKRCICTDAVWGNLLGLGTFFVNITVFFAHYRVVSRGKLTYLREYHPIKGQKM